MIPHVRWALDHAAAMGILCIVLWLAAAIVAEGREPGAFGWLSLVLAFWAAIRLMERER